jgi:multicomponent Na+:H+ antiporter subunit G
VTAAVVAVLGAIGVAASLSGALGIARMPDVYTRIQCSSKSITLGAVPALLAVAVGKGWDTLFGTRALLVAFLLLVMNATASHALARAAYKAGIPMWEGSVRDDALAEAGAKGDARDTGS